MATNERFLFVGGFDEIIRIYDLKKRKEMGELEGKNKFSQHIYLGHTGTISSMICHNNYIFTGSEDGTVKAWN